MGSTWGSVIKLSIFGESHGAGIGVVIDGFPAGVQYDEAFVLREMERRAPGRNKQSTQRKEADTPVIQSGLLNGQTTGAPICAVIQNTNQRLGRLRCAGRAAPSGPCGLHRHGALPRLQ